MREDKVSGPVLVRRRSTVGYSGTGNRNGRLTRKASPTPPRYSSTLLPPPNADQRGTVTRFDTRSNEEDGQLRKLELIMRSKKRDMLYSQKPPCMSRFCVLQITSSHFWKLKFDRSQRHIAWPPQCLPA